MPSAVRAKKGSLSGWILFLATLLVLSFAAMPGFTRYSTFADRTLIAIRLSLVLALSVLAVRNWMSEDPNRYRDARLLKRLRNWYYDEETPTSPTRDDKSWQPGTRHP